MSAKSLTKTATSIKIKVAVLAGLITIAGLSYTAFSIVLKPYVPSITSLTAYDPSGASRPNNQFKAEDTLTVIGGNFLQDGLFLDTVDVYWLNQNKNEIKQHNVWDEVAVESKKAKGELGKTEIKNIVIDNDVVNYFSEHANDKLYLKFIFHFHKKWVGTKYTLTAQSSKPLALAAVPPPALGRQVAIPASWGLGDVYDDPAKRGEVNYDDLLVLGSILKKTIAPDNDQKLQGDLNLNGILDFSDYIILNYLIDVDASLTSSDLPIILGNINRSEQAPTKPNTQITINDDDLNLLDNILTAQGDEEPVLYYSTFLSADLNGDNDLTVAEDQDLLSQFLNKTIEYVNLPKFIGPNYPPIASAGPNVAKTIPDVPSEDITITLDGRGSIDREGDLLDYNWEILFADYPDGTTAAMLVSPLKTITNGQDEEAAYTLSIANQNDLVKGTQVIIENHLTVTDAKGQEKTDAMQIVVTTPGFVNYSPVAVFTADPLTVAPGGKVNLDGWDSHDPNLDPLTYQWEITSGGGSLTDANKVVAEYTAPAGEGNVKIKLTVTDDKEAKGEASVEARVKIGEESVIQITSIQTPQQVIIGQDLIQQVSSDDWQTLPYEPEAHPASIPQVITFTIENTHPVPNDWNYLYEFTEFCLELSGDIGIISETNKEILHKTVKWQASDQAGGKQESMWFDLGNAYWCFKWDEEVPIFLAPKDSVNFEQQYTYTFTTKEPIFKVSNSGMIRARLIPPKLREAYSGKIITATVSTAIPEMEIIFQGFGPTGSGVAGDWNNDGFLTYEDVSVTFKYLTMTGVLPDFIDQNFPYYGISGQDAMSAYNNFELFKFFVNGLSYVENKGSSVQITGDAGSSQKLMEIAELTGNPKVVEEEDFQIAYDCTTRDFYDKGGNVCYKVFKEVYPPDDVLQSQELPFAVLTPSQQVIQTSDNPIRLSGANSKAGAPNYHWKFYSRDAEYWLYPILTLEKLSPDQDTEDPADSWMRVADPSRPLTTAPPGNPVAYILTGDNDVYSDVYLHIIEDHPDIWRGFVSAYGFCQTIELKVNEAQGMGDLWGREWKKVCWKPGL